MIVAELLVLAMFLMHRRILDLLKARLTYPRTGYARPPIDFPSKNESLDKLHTPQTPVDENVTTFRNHTVGSFVLGSILLQLLETRWGLPLVMVAVAAAVHLRNKDAEHPYSWLAVLPIAAAGLAAVPLDLNSMSRSFLSLVIGGGWVLSIGAWTLIRYLRAHPRTDGGKDCPS